MLMIAGEYGPTFEVTTRAASRLPGAQRVILDGYEAQGWADVAAERSSEVVAAVTGFLTGHAADEPKLAGEGRHAGITYRIEGSGPALILMPFFLAASQWDPVGARAGRAFHRDPARRAASRRGRDA